MFHISGRQSYAPALKPYEFGKRALVTETETAGSHSFSRHRRGTCSYHGGVAVWY
jgi:hypothetical protein